MPARLVAMECDDPVRQPRDVAGQLFAVEWRQADGVEQLGADAARLEVDKRGRTDIEGEAAVPEVSGASAGMAVRFQHSRGETTCLQAQCRRDAGQPATEYHDVTAALWQRSDRARWRPQRRHQHRF